MRGHEGTHFGAHRRGEGHLERKQEARVRGRARGLRAEIRAGRARGLRDERKCRELVSRRQRFELLRKTMEMELVRFFALSSFTILIDIAFAIVNAMAILL